MSRFDFSGKVAIITGSSRGIGKGIAIALAREGAYVVLNGRNYDRLKEAEDEIKRINSNVYSVVSDVARPEGGRKLIDETISVFKRIDILINNVFDLQIYIIFL